MKVAICYRYFIKTVDGDIIVKYLTETAEGHENWSKVISSSESYVSCYREYVHEINLELALTTETIKTEEVKENEEV